MVPTMMENLDKLCQLKENYQDLNIGCKWRYKQMRYEENKLNVNKVTMVEEQDSDDTDTYDCELEIHKMYHCDFDNCPKAYKSWFNLQRHRSLHYKSVHSKPYLCDWQECHAQFKKLKNLIVHRRLHTGLRPFKCDYKKCNKEFRSAHSLSSHRRRHERSDS